MTDNRTGDNPSEDFLFERMMILNAYHLPAVDYNLLYPSISPVNTFRLIFNQYFESEYELLDDVAYYSSRKEPFDFTNVTSRILAVLEITPGEYLILCIP